MEKLQCIETPLLRESAVALGLFDGVHLGHQAVLDAVVSCAKAQGLVPCAFTFASDSLSVKQGVPLTYLYTDCQKRRLLQECGVERVYCPPFSALCSLDGEEFCRRVLVELFHAREVFCGGDFRFGAKAAWDTAALCRFGSVMGFQVHLVEPVLCGGKKISSTAIRQCVLKGDMSQAARLLGKPYHISGTVAHGKALGRTRQVPTINIPFKKGQLVPRHGVYVSKTITPKGTFDSLTNVGVTPTVSKNQVPVAETYLLHFEGDLYAQPCTVQLRHFLRDERKFVDIEALYTQIAKDEEACIKWLREN